MAIDLFQTRNKNSENYSLVIQLMLQRGVQQLKLPAFVFFKQGQLVIPSAVQGAVVQGLQSEADLKAIIEKIFFGGVE